MSDHKKYLLTIIGPTAIGKTALSIQLAKHFACDIISCDSRQFYQEMTIGTAVPEIEELNMVPHHFIQNKSIFTPFTVADFEKEALEKLDSLFKRNSVQIMTGGSGLYVDAVLKGFDYFPDISETIRIEVRNQYKKEGLNYLQQSLKQHDPGYFYKLEKENPQTLLNPQRMMRFTEVCLGTGKPYSSFLDTKKTPRSFTPIMIGLEAKREIMYERINKRVDIMFEKGLPDEAKKLFPYRHLNALQTVGYQEIFDFFEGKVTMNEAKEEIKKNTRRFAKRQLTWFRRTKNVSWFDFQTPLEEIIQYIEKQIIH